jgi:hypothetical protein
VSVASLLKDCSTILIQAVPTEIEIISLRSELEKVHGLSPVHKNNFQPFGVFFFPFATVGNSDRSYFIDFLGFYPNFNTLLGQRS